MIDAPRVMSDPDAYVAKTWPDLPRQQQRSLATWLHNGWEFVNIGKDGEVNLQRGNERGYIRADGVYRPD